MIIPCFAVSVLTAYGFLHPRVAPPVLSLGYSRSKQTSDNREISRLVIRLL